MEDKTLTKRSQGASAKRESDGEEGREKNERKRNQNVRRK